MSLINTRIQNLRSTDHNLDKWETRPSQYGGFDVFMKQTDEAGSIITMDLKEKAEKSMGTTLEATVIDYDGTVTIGNVRSAVIADSENTSQLYTVVFATYSWGFTIVPALFANNDLKIQQDFNAKFNKYLYEFGTTIDTVAIAAIEAARTQILGDSLVYTFAADTVTATNAQRERIIGDLDPMMKSNDFHVLPITLLGNRGVESQINQLDEKGLYNQENKRIQYADKELAWSNRITNGVGVAATGYAIAPGSLGLLWRFDPSARMADRAGTSHEWDISMLPLLNMPIGTYYYESVGDQSAIAGAASTHLTRARKQHYGFDIDLAFVVAYNSDPATRASSILKWEITTA